MYWGIDVGSVSVNVVLLDENRTIRACRIARSGCRHRETVQELIQEIAGEQGVTQDDSSVFVGTGYGRRNIPDVQYTFTEITCHAVGVHYLYPQSDRIIDIGGQDSKVIRLSPDGDVDGFVMNDKCAAGTGRFLEVMAGVLQMDLDTFSRCGLEVGNPYPISSTCTVFAESEVISGIAKGIGAEAIAAGLYEAVASRIAGLAASLGQGKQVVLTGGVAKSEGIRQRLAQRYPDLLVPDEPQITGALGAALMGWEERHG